MMAKNGKSRTVAQPPAPKKKVAKIQTGGDTAEALRAADAAWLKAYQEKDAVKAAGFYAGQGAMLTPNRPLLTGKEALAKFIAKSFEMRDYHITWHPNKVEVAQSGDLGYTSGSYEMSFREPSGKLFLDKGKYLMVWKKQMDGAWKVLFDVSNSDLPPARGSS
jgi:ketosteroid isomerase-like protein